MRHADRDTGGVLSERNPEANPIVLTKLDSLAERTEARVANHRVVVGSTASGEAPGRWPLIGHGDGSVSNTAEVQPAAQAQLQGESPIEEEGFNVARPGARGGFPPLEIDLRRGE